MPVLCGWSARRNDCFRATPGDVLPQRVSIEGFVGDRYIEIDVLQ
jgi:hypothetical protein